MSELAGNAQLLEHNRGFITDVVGSGERGIAPSIDFFAISAQANGAPLQVQYPKPVAYSPAHIAVTASTRQPEAVRQFVEFILSEHGQRLLFHSDIRKLPVSPDVYADKPKGQFAPLEEVVAVRYPPLYNQLSCLACHPKNGRGSSPETPDQAMRSMLVRLSVPGNGAHGGPRAHPVYSNQLNEQGVPSVPGKGWVRVSYRAKPIKLPDGETYNLREPVYEFSDLQYGPLAPDTLFSPRIGPPVFGLGLLEAVSDEMILQLVEQGRARGVNGRPNVVWDS